MARERSRQRIEFIGFLLVIAAVACGGPEDEPAGESEDQVGGNRTGECMMASRADLSVDTAALCSDPSISFFDQALYCQQPLSQPACMTNYAVRRCFDRATDRHVESMSAWGCQIYPAPQPPGEDVFYFALSPQPGADPRPIFRCRNGISDRSSRSRTCDDWDRPPVSKHGFSYAPGTPGTTPVYRCKRDRVPDWFLSRQAGCEGHVQQALIGYARDTASPSP